MTRDASEQNKSASQPPPASSRKHMACHLPPLRFPVAALLLVFFLFTGAPDQFAEQQLEETRNQTAGLLAAAVSVDAGISVLQSMEFGIGVSAHPGELLDPVNDTVERVSWVLFLALGSLVLQQLILDGASSSVFNWILLVVALVAVGTYSAPFVGPDRAFVSGPGFASLRKGMIRAFCIFAVLRLIVPAFMATCLLISQWLDPAIGDGRATLDRLRESVSVLEEQTSVESESSASDTTGTAVLAGIDQDALQQQRSDLEANATEKRLELEEFEREIVRIDNELDDLRGDSAWVRLLNEAREGVPEWIGGAPPGEQIAALESERDEVVTDRDHVREEIREIGLGIDCIDRQQSGETCDTFWQQLREGASGISESVSSLLRSVDLRERFQEFSDQAMYSMYDLTKSVIAVVIKNIVLPIGFLWMVAKLALPFAGWLTNWSAHPKSSENSGRDRQGPIEQVRGGGH